MYNILYTYNVNLTSNYEFPVIFYALFWLYLFLYSAEVKQNGNQYFQISQKEFHMNKYL